MKRPLTILIGKCLRYDPIIKLVTEYCHNGILDNMVKIMQDSNIFCSIDCKTCTLDNYEKVIDSIPTDNIIFQLCDGTEEDGYPGISIVKYLESTGRMFTGSRSSFYDISTSKLKMKRLFDKFEIPTSPYVVNTEHIRQKLKYPVIIKPDVSYASIGITKESVLHNSECPIPEYYFLNPDKYFIEEFLNGREFTVLVMSKLSLDTYGRESQQIQVYPPVERVFENTINFLSFDDYWKTKSLKLTQEGYIYDSKLDQSIVNYKTINNFEERELYENLKKLATRAYVAVNGTSYGRVDIRSDTAGNLYVLEVNAMPSLSFDTETSVGQILTLHGNIYHKFIIDLFN